MRVGLLFLVGLVLATPVAAADQVGGSLSTTRAAVSSGVFDFTADGASLLLPLYNPNDDAQDEHGGGSFAVDADRLTIVEFRYEVAARTNLLGQEPALNDHRNPPKRVDHVFQDARLEVIGWDENADLRITAGAESTARMGDAPGANLYGGAADAGAGWDRSSHQRRDISWPEEIDPFFEEQTDQMLVTAGGTNIQVQGTQQALLRGVDVRIEHRDGVVELQGRLQEDPVAPNQVINSRLQTFAWFYLSTADESAAAEAAWGPSAGLYANEIEMLGTGQLDLDAAFGQVLRADGSIESVRNEAVRFLGPLEANLRCESLDGVSGINLGITAVHVGDVSATPMTAVSAPAATAFSTAWLVVLFAAAVLSGAAPPMAMHWRRARARPPSPVPARPTDMLAAPNLPNDAGSNQSALTPAQQAIHLVNEGQIDQALPQLRLAVKGAPQNSEARYCLGVALARQGDVDKGLEHIEYAIRLDPAFLGLLLTDDDTKPFRHAAPVARFVRRQARRFQDHQIAGYA